MDVTYSLADQSPATTKSMGILQVSLKLAEHLLGAPGLGHLHVLGNRHLAEWLPKSPRLSISEHRLALGTRAGRVLWDQWRVYREARLRRSDWLLLPKGFASFLLPCPVRLASYVHDTMHEYYRAAHPSGFPLAERRYFQASLRATLAHSDLVFTNSEFTREEVLGAARRWKLSPPNVRTAGIGFDRPPPSSATRSRIVALVSPLPHKRSDLTVEYLRRWQSQSGFDGSIDLVGRLPPHVAVPEGGPWRLHDRPPDSHYRQLLSEAVALAYFSEYEGFGMPPVEATLAGAAAVYSDLPATREVMEGRGFPFHLRSYDDFGAKLDAAIRAPPETIQSWSSELCARRSWPEVALRVAEAMRAFEGGRQL
ncbi:MAG: hypothetical protein HYZ28_11135 [Myxococcales bacterium]|nr:hypothetical protein [Myxococcales bacterium]